MKKTLLLLSLILLKKQLFSQETTKLKKGFIGISFGPSIHTGPGFYPTITTAPGAPFPNDIPGFDRNDIFLSLNLIDGGYTFNKKWGVAFKLQGSAFSKKMNQNELAMNFAMLMIGPMYSIELDEKITLDFKTRLGAMFTGIKFEEMKNGFLLIEEFENYNLGMELGASLRYHIAPKWSWINNLEFQNQFGEKNDFKISNVNITTGIGFRF